MTWEGHLLNHPICMHTYTGFLIADGQSGPFRLEIGGVSAVAKIEGRVPDSALTADGGEEVESGGQGRREGR